MTSHETYLLSNLSIGQFIEFRPQSDQEVIVAARSLLSESGLAPDVQHGFFLSVFPTTADDTDPESGSAPAEPGSAVVADLPHEEQVPASAGPESRSADDEERVLSPLAAAAAQGPLHWTDDAEIDPPAGEKPSYIGVALDGTGR